MSENVDETPQAAHVRQMLADQSDTLHDILAALRGQATNVAYTNAAHRELTMKDWPVAGLNRVFAQRYGAGNDNLAVPSGSGVIVIPGNSGRAGLQITNIGANPVALYLTADPLVTTARPCVWLGVAPAAFSVWNGKLSDRLWTGDVVAVGKGGVSTLAVAEF
jgi:hypothetical protein